MITPPTAPSPGKPVSAGFFSRLIAWVKSGQLIDGVGYRLNRTPNGTSLVINPSKDVTAAPAAKIPWTFSCTEDPDTGERTGGWANCILQLGYHKFMYSADLRKVSGRGDSSGEITGTDLTEDGDYFVEVNAKTDTAEIKLAGEDPIRDDIPNSIVRIWIGKVKDGVQVSGIHHHPVVYKYI